MDSRIIGDDLGDYDNLGDLIGDLIGDDDGLGDLEMGRRGQRRRIKRLAKKTGMVAMTKPQAMQLASAARQAQLKALNTEAMDSGDSMTAGHYVADSGQRELYLPFSGTASLAAAVGSTAALSVTVQRPLMFKRLILEAIDGTTLADVLATAAVASFLIGVQPVFNAAGLAPARAYAYNAVGNHLMTPVARVGTNITLNLQRIALGANAAVCSGYLVGVSANE